MNALTARLRSAAVLVLAMARARPCAAALFALSVITAAVMSGRLAIYMLDPSRPSFSVAPFDAGAVRHSCLSAYVRAGELSERGLNVYDPRNFPRRASPGDINFAPLKPDPVFHYPPPALVPIRAALALTRDFRALRAAWFGIEALLLLAGLLALAGAARSRAALLLIPVVWVAPPVLLTLQFGNFHLAALALAAVAWALFARRRDVLGGAFLALAVAGKIFPGILLVALAARRRWRAVAATLGFIALAFVASWVALGAGPLRDFFFYAMPRVSGGRAFLVVEADLRAIALDWSALGSVRKLDAIGVPGMSDALGSFVSWGYAVAILVAAAWAARGAPSPQRDAQLCMALLTLASLRSPFAPQTLAAAAPAWLVSLLAADARGPRDAVRLAVVFGLVAVILPFEEPVKILIWSSLGQLFAVGACVFALARGRGAGRGPDAC